jgi:CRP-like cAMP-binding protein
MSYLATDPLQLRLFAAGGVSCAIVFQYYREKPLWLPLKWNALFLLINTTMALILLSEAAGAEHLTAEERGIYETVFKSKGLKPTEFLRLIRVAERREVPKGATLLRAGGASTNLYLLLSGRLTIRDAKGKEVDVLYPYQFAGALSYLKFMALEFASASKKETREARRLYAEHEGGVAGGADISTSLSSSSSASKTSSNTTSTSTSTSTSSSSSNSSSSSSSSDGKQASVGLQDVVAEEACVVYCLPFEDVAELLGHSPQIALALERCLSSDLSTKMMNRLNRAPQ